MDKSLQFTVSHFYSLLQPVKPNTSVLLVCDMISELEKLNNNKLKTGIMVTGYSKIEQVPVFWDIKMSVV